MNKIFGLIFILGLAPAQSYSQGGYFYFVSKTDSATADGSYPNFNVRVHVKNSLFNSILEDFFNSQQQAAKLLSFREEAERRQKEEAEIQKRMAYKKRIDIFKDRIGLTEEESIEFWPNYDEYYNKLDNIYEKRQVAIRNLCDIHIVLTEQQSSIWADVYVNSFKEEANLMEQYRKKFKSILGKKWTRLYDAEYQFKMWMLRNL
ncbi:MAG: hypothetical protein LBG92_11750 [Prevotellaceae bacterium]|jgi:hypothetical protein|nr:hypothetical protein [Prevotellaceae bacterium]